MSEGLKDAKGLTWIPKGKPLPDGSLTAEFNKRADNVRLGKTEGADGRLNDWMGGDHAYRIREEVVGLGSYNRTLTILTCAKLSIDNDPVPDEDEEEERLIESWTPRLR
jgi:hypothetical protein